MAEQEVGPVPPTAANANVGPDPTAQLSKLQSVLFAYADKYMSAIAQITADAQRQDPDDPQLRLLMHNLKLVTTAAVQELAVSPNPESTLLDMMVFATLHRMVMEEDWAAETYGESIDTIVKVMGILENDIWTIATEYLDENEVAEVRELIDTWKEQHPGLRVVSYIRFSDFAELRSQSPLIEKTRSTGFLVDTSGALQAVDEALLLSERVLHYSQRLPFILEWQIEKMLYQLALEPEVRQSLDQSRSITQSLDRFTSTVELMPDRLVEERKATIEQMAQAIATERSDAIRDLAEALAAERRATVEDVSGSLATERAALFAELDAREAMLTGVIAETRRGLEDANRLAVDLEKTTLAINEVVVNTDRLLERFDFAPDAAGTSSEPFDINSYIAALQELTVAIREANTLVLATERVVHGDNLVEDVFDKVLRVGSILILIFCIGLFITMLVYRAAARHIVPRSSFEHPAAGREDRSG